MNKIRKMAGKKLVEIKWRELIYLIMIFNFVLNGIDYLQSAYYLNKHGFENELNPLVTNNVMLILVKFIYFSLFGTLFILMKVLDSGLTKEFFKQNPKYVILDRKFIRVLTFILVFLDFLFITKIVSSNFAIIFASLI